MEIIDQTSRPLDLWGYARASLLVAWAYDKYNGVQLLFGRIELRPAELGSISRTRQLITPVRLPGPTSRSVFAGIVDVSAIEAVEWYAQALSGAWFVPPALVPNRAVPLHRALGAPLCEPVWPQLNLSVRPHSALPCIPSSLECPRVHHRLAATPWPLNDAAWTDAEREGASVALAPIAGFELALHPHLWESLRLVLPNPVLRTAGTQLVESHGHEGLGVSLIPRCHASLTDLLVTIWEERDGLVLPLAAFRPQGSRTLIRLAGVREATAMTIDSDRLGRLLVTEAMTFVAAIGFSMRLTTMQRDVTAHRHGKSPVRYSVPVHEKAVESLVGKEKRETPIDLLRHVRQTAEERARDISEEEIWFSENVDAAQARLRELISHASKLVLVVDYFFGAADAGVLLPAVGTFEAEVRVLTSREGLSVNKRLRENALALARVLSQLTGQLRMQHIEVRAMQGQAEIHDRFLVLDDRIYLLGSSVNNYGERGTMLVRLRGTATVRKAIEQAWERAVPLGSLMAEPVESPRTPPGRLKRARTALRTIAVRLLRHVAGGRV